MAASVIRPPAGAEWIFLVVDVAVTLEKGSETHHDDDFPQSS
jgi:hypothetical protein